MNSSRSTLGTIRPITRSSKDVFDFLGGATFQGVIVYTHEGGKNFQPAPMIARQAGGGDDEDGNVEVAVAAAFQAGHAQAAQAKDRAALRAFGDAQALFAAKRGHNNIRAQRRLGNGNRDGVVEVVAAPLEEQSARGFSG